MKAIGVVRRVDELGRIVIPKSTRRELGIDTSDPLEIYVDGESIILKKYQPGCHMCGSLDNLQEVKGLKICKCCIDEIKGGC